MAARLSDSAHAADAQVMLNRLNNVSNDVYSFEKDASENYRVTVRIGGAKSCKRKDISGYTLTIDEVYVFLAGVIAGLSIQQGKHDGAAKLHQVKKKPESKIALLT